MKKFLIALSLFCSKAFALDAVVTVLETPLLKYKSYESPVVQYLRKGDVIKIHPSVANQLKYEEHAPSPEKLEQIRKRTKNEDPLFKGSNENTAFVEDEFIPTLDRQGNIVYVMSEHIYVYFGDKRELDQKLVKRDPTDYRLEEPLPKAYPLKSPQGYRGQFLLGVTQPYYESYPYKEAVKNKGYMSPVDANLTLMKIAKGNYQERLFIGGTLNLRAFENSYSFVDRRFSKEQALRLGLGPTISYDAFKGTKNRVNLSGTILINFIDRLAISQSLDSRQEERLYTGYSLAPRLSIQYHRKEIMEELDFVLGTTLEMGTATTYRAQNGAAEATWWDNIGSDKFTTRTTYTLGAYIGVQSAY